MVRDGLAQGHLHTLHGTLRGVCTVHVVLEQPLHSICTVFAWLAQHLYALLGLHRALHGSMLIRLGQEAEEGPAEEDFINCFSSVSSLLKPA